MSKFQSNKVKLRAIVSCIYGVLLKSLSGHILPSACYRALPVVPIMFLMPVSIPMVELMVPLRYIKFYVCFRLSFLILILNLLQFS